MVKRLGIREFEQLLQRGWSVRGYPGWRSLHGYIIPDGFLELVGPRQWGAGLQVWVVPVTRRVMEVATEAKTRAYDVLGEVPGHE